jgi:hypothetical protein
MSHKPTESDVAGRIRGLLDQSAANLDQRVSLRLYEARCDALRHQAAPVAVLGLAGVGYHLADMLHHHYRGILAFIALAVGAMGVQVWHNFRQADELAEIDTELLSDEVPPSAYTDPGFQEWLHHLSESEEEPLQE